MKNLAPIIIAFFLIFNQGNVFCFEAIEDNSMYIEEAYNQEFRVVQHIFNCSIFSKPEKSKAFTFTQEWPLIGQDIQFSYMIPYSAIGDNSGIGDAMINFRYQALMNEKIACSPRLSYVSKSGNASKGLGNGSNGIEACIPLSCVLAERFAMHFNIGSTHFFKMQATKKSMTNLFAGFSGVYHFSETFDLMLENMMYIQDMGDAKVKTYIVSPLIRYAINIDKLQIVPMIGMPIKLSSNKPDFGAAIYLSFEHPF